MKRTALLVAVTALLLSACGESKLPEPTGKGSVQAINAIPASPAVAFLIEERGLASIEYKNASSAASYDDFSYTFNFEVQYVGDAGRTRIASLEMPVVRDTNHMLVLGGTLDNPTINTWESAERTWAEDDTNFELRFGHAAASFNALDVYFVPQNEVAGPGNLAATLAYGEASAASELAEGDFTIVVTTAGDINDVLYQSNEVTYPARRTLLVTVFDGDENEFGQLAVRGIQSAGSAILFAEAGTLPTVRFVHTSVDLGPVDIFDDEALANRVVANQVFGDISADLEYEPGTRTFTWTPPDDTGVVLIEQEISTFLLSRLTVYAAGIGGTYGVVPVQRNLRSISTQASFSLFHAAANNPLVDLYIEEPGTLLEDATPDFFGLTFAATTTRLPLPAGEFEVSVTTSGEKTVLAGPFTIDVALGDVVEGLILDDPADTAIAEIRLIP